MISERVKRLMSIAGVGEITALTWVLEIGDPARFSSSREAVSYFDYRSELFRETLSRRNPEPEADHRLPIIILSRRQRPVLHRSHGFAGRGRKFGRADRLPGRDLVVLLKVAGSMLRPVARRASSRSMAHFTQRSPVGAVR